MIAGPKNHEIAKRYEGRCVKSNHNSSIIIVSTGDPVDL
jgi:hypothetical protein